MALMTGDSSRAGDVEDFDAGELDRSRWVPWYLPHWSSRETSMASYTMSESHLRLEIPVDQGLWCSGVHETPLRVSAVASGLYAGPLGSTTGQQPFRPGQTVVEEQNEFRGWLLGRGRLSVVARADLSHRSMASVWLTGFEDAPHRCGEICLFEVFGETLIDGPTAGIGAGVHPFRDPALVDDFSVTTRVLDLRDWHEYAVEMGDEGATWFVDGEPLRRTTQAVDYPLQMFIGVFDFPDRPVPEDARAGARRHVPTLDIDRVTFTPQR